ncbi:restriction endonuclease subunit S [Phascolarctobacterium succinatutens]|uniref:restriction endonuclease subunit S n=1 Tax=Phascolarctobacterium succinatutens TaxID=626940 RepID=UPI0030793307
MSNLEELIERLCPDGVEYKTLGEICDIFTGGDLPKNCIKGSVSDKEHPYPVWGNGKEVYGFADKFKIAEDAVVISSIGANTGSVYFHKAFFTPIIRLKVILPKKDNILIRYIYHYLSNIKIKSKSSSVPNMNASEIKAIKIPVPPLEVQREIVRILDNFTFLTTELAAELAARQKQYEYYKEYLFENHIFDVEWKRLDELFPFIRNGFVGTIKSFFTNETDGIRYLEGTNIHDGVISDNEVLYVTKEFHKKHIKNQLKADDILMVQSGHIGECAVVGKKYEGSNCHALIIMSNGGKCLSKYYVYYFHTIKGFKSLTPAITGGTIKHVLAGKIGKIKVPVPSLEQQQRIVDILDRFDTLCNDISSGLPAEIEMRQKQYEYYRDKLLTFKELKKEA